MAEILELQIPNDETCILCDQPKKLGIHIFDRYVCVECERQLVRTDAGSELYKTYVQKLRKLLPEIERALQKS